MKITDLLNNRTSLKPPLIRWAFRALLCLCLVITVLGLPARNHELHIPGYRTIFSLDTNAHIVLFFEIVMAAIWFGVAGILVWKKPDNRLALFMALTSLMLGITQPGMSDALINPEHSSIYLFFHWPVLTMRALAAICSLVALYIFPDGRFAVRGTRTLAIIWAVLCLAWLIIPDLPFNVVYGPTWRATANASLIFNTIWFGTGIFVQIYRYRYAQDPIQRQQIKWLSLALTTTAVGATIYYAILALPYDTQIMYYTEETYTVYFFGRPLMQLVFMNLIPIYCLAVSIFRYRLWNIDIVINRTLVYGSLTAIVIGLYSLIVTGFGELFQLQIQRGSSFFVSLMATGIVAIVFQPMRDRLQSGVNRLMYGDRDNPVAVLSRIGQRLESARALDEVLSIIVESTAQALKLPYAAIEVNDDGKFSFGKLESQLVVGGASSSIRLQLPLIYQSESVGLLIVSQRAPEEEFNSADKVLLENIARQAGVVVYTVRLARRLTSELQQSREKLVNTREEERRRLRRDLHDGLGPSLAGLALQLDTARNLLNRDVSAVDQLLVELRTQTREAIGDIRRLVYNLRPPALDELGLVTALREQALQYADVLQVSIETPQDLPVLSAAVEVATYRIVLEAITNTVKHAHAHKCRVNITLENGLKIEVADDGIGVPFEKRVGIGLNSMRERAIELGGTFQVESTPGQGTSIRAWLPLME